MHTCIFSAPAVASSMVVSVQAWRARIGAFSSSGNFRRVIFINSGSSGGANSVKYGIILTIIAVLLVIGGIEVNPGPPPADNSDVLRRLDEMMRANVETEKRIMGELTGLRDQMTEIKNTMATTNLELGTVKEKVGQLESDNKTVCSRLEVLETKIRKNNAMFYNVPVVGDISKENTTQTIIDLLHTKKFPNPPTVNDIDQCYRLGKKDDNKPIFVSFKDHSVKINVMKNVGLLKGSNIGISDDLTQQQQQNRRILLEGAQKARKAGLNARLQRNSRLVVEGQSLSVGDLEAPSWFNDLTRRLQLPAGGATGGKRASGVAVLAAVGDVMAREGGAGPSGDFNSGDSDVFSDVSDSEPAGGRKSGEGNFKMPSARKGRRPAKDAQGRLTRSNSTTSLTQ